MKTDLLFYVPFPGHDEDAPPVADERIAIVCDGLGGAGGVEFEVDGEVHTCAYYASRAVISVVKSFLEENYELAFSDGMRHLDQLAIDLKIAIRDGLQKYSNETGISFKGRKSGGSMVKLLPTTLASCIYRDKGDSIDVICFWAGDSRCYALGKDGLHQLTDDDARGYIDAMECIIQDAVMNNVICLDHDFHISWRAYSIPKPCVVFTASDGCFAYLESPMSFESIFLPRTGADFDLEASVQASLDAHENDDRTLAGHIFGLSSPEEYREAFCPRGDMIESEFISKMVLTPRIDELRAKRNEMGSRELSEEEKTEYKEVKAELKDLRKQNEDLMRSLWSGYSKGYLLEPLKPEQDPVVIPEPEVEEPEPEVVEPEPVKEPEPAKTETEEPKEKPTEVESPPKADPESPSIEDELSPSRIEDVPTEEPARTDSEPLKATKPAVTSGPDWTVPKRTINDTGVSLIMPYALSKSFMKEIRSARMIEGHIIRNNWFLSGDTMSTVCGRGLNPRNTRRLFVKKRDGYDIDRDKKVMDTISYMNRDGRLILPSERYMSTGMYIQTFICTQNGMEGLDSLRRYEKSDKLHLMLEICRSVKSLHDAGLVHGAISSDAVMITQTPGGHLRPIICNFCDAFPMKDADRQERMDPLERGPWYDVYCLGLLFYRICVRNVSDEIIISQANIYKKGSTRNWVMDLICSMLNREPSKRPEMPEVIDCIRRHML